MSSPVQSPALRCISAECWSTSCPQSNAGGDALAHVRTSLQPCSSRGLAPPVVLGRGRRGDSLRPWSWSLAVRAYADGGIGTLTLGLHARRALGGSGLFRSGMGTRAHSVSLAHRWLASSAPLACACVGASAKRRQTRTQTQCHLLTDTLGRTPSVTRSRWVTAGDAVVRWGLVKIHKNLARPPRSQAPLLTPAASQTPCKPRSEPPTRSEQVTCAPPDQVDIALPMTQHVLTPANPPSPKCSCPRPTGTAHPIPPMPSTQL